jgi:hypothetical protein
MAAAAAAAAIAAALVVAVRAMVRAMAMASLPHPIPPIPHSYPPTAHPLTLSLLTPHHPPAGLSSSSSVLSLLALL